MAAFSTVLIREYYLIFYREKNKKVRRYISYGFFFLWQIFSMQSMSHFSVWLRIILNIIIVFLISYNFNGVYKGKMILSFIYDALWMLCEVLTGCIFWDIDGTESHYEMICSVASKIFLFVLIKILQHIFHNNIENQLSWEHNAILMLIPVGSIYIAYHIFSMSNTIGIKRYRLTSFVILIVLAVINYAMVYIYKQLSDYFETRNKKEIYELEIELLNEHVKEKENTMMQLRKTKHDLKHNLLYAIDMLECREYENLNVYLKQLSNLQPLEQFTVVHTDNSLVDTIVNYKYVTAEKYGIEFKAKLDIPTMMPFNQPELCVILGNALDNAIEACLRGNIDSPRIMLNIRLDGDNLIIIVENTFDGKIERNENREVETRKRNRDEHGIGLISIEKSLEVFHGYCDVDVKENIYSLKMILYPQEAKELI